MTRQLVVLLLLSSFSLVTLAQTRSKKNSSNGLPPGYWPLEKSQPIIDKTQTIRLNTDLSRLSAGERKAVEKLIEVGRVFQSLYEKQRHPEAVTGFAALSQLDRQMGSPATTQNLLTLYRLFQGPIATTLENKREAFLLVAGLEPGKNVYPWEVKKENVEEFLQTHPEQRAKLLGLRTVVRWANPKILQRIWPRSAVTPHWTFSIPV